LSSKAASRVDNGRHGDGHGHGGVHEEGGDGVPRCQIQVRLKGSVIPGRKLPQAGMVTVTAASEFQGTKSKFCSQETIIFNNRQFPSRNLHNQSPAEVSADPFHRHFH
jgi:hypothetical protein